MDFTLELQYFCLIFNEAYKCIWVFFCLFKKNACKHLSHTNADRKPATTKKICNYTCYNLTNNTDKTKKKKGRN